MVSVLHKFLNNTSPDSNVGIKAEWEEDMGVHFTTEEWNSKFKKCGRCFQLYKVQKSHKRRPWSEHHSSRTGKKNGPFIVRILLAWVRYNRHPDSQSVTQLWSEVVDTMSAILNTSMAKCPTVCLFSQKTYASPGL